jgi:hypothetical protein
VPLPAEGTIHALACAKWSKPRKVSIILYPEPPQAQTPPAVTHYQTPSVSVTCLKTDTKFHTQVHQQAKL